MQSTSQAGAPSASLRPSPPTGMDWDGFGSEPTTNVVRRTMLATMAQESFESLNDSLIDLHVYPSHQVRHELARSVQASFADRHQVWLDLVDTDVGPIFLGV